jgi:hypothetical protein
MKPYTVSATAIALRTCLLFTGDSFSYKFVDAAFDRMVPNIYYEGCTQQVCGSQQPALRHCGGSFAIHCTACCISSRAFLSDSFSLICA